MKDSGILEIEIKYIKIHEGKNFSGINLRQNRVPWQGCRASVYSIGIPPVARSEGGPSSFLPCSFVPTFSSPHQPLQLPRTTASLLRIKSFLLPSPLVSSSQMLTRINAREEKSTSRIKKEGVHRVKGWRERS